MGIRQKFFALAGVAGVIMAIVAIVGYVTSANSLEQTVESEIISEVGRQAAQADGWLAEKSQVAESTAAFFESLSAKEDNLARSKFTTVLGTKDSEVLAVTNVLEDNFAWSSIGGNMTGKAEWTKRPWYIDVQSAGKTIYTDPYKDKTTGAMVVTIATPFKRNGALGGAVCEDVKMDALTKQAQSAKYKGQGKGIIFNPESGVIIASATEGEALKKTTENPVLKDHMAEMKANDKGYFMTSAGGEDKVVGYAKIPSSGWIVAISAPSSFVFAQLRTLKIVYGLLTVIGIVLIVGACLMFSNRIVRVIVGLQQRVAEVAEGRLDQENLDVDSDDELGMLADDVNKMKENLRKLIKQMASTAEQVASSSEELTAGAHQAAEAATDVAQTVVEVANGMEKQLKSIDDAKKEVDTCFVDITNMTKQSEAATTDSQQTAAAAEKGGELMEGAMTRMDGIEASVMNSAEVVKKLGENSQAIGQIVDTISGIADQTNLLALNAAIEAARAGEHGRGFAVVAEEVRKLAGESQTSTEQIRTRIASIQKDTEAAVVAMQKGTDEVKEGSAAIREVGEQFQTILSMVEGIKTKMVEIKNSATTVSNGTTHIVSAVDDIDEVSRTTSGHTQTISAAAEEQSASSEEIASASQALATLATDLQTATNKFKV